jgi:putative lipoic acid-binding regulatory protein
MNTKQAGLRFPCSFPLKVLGFNTEEFSSAVLSIFQKHLDEDKISCSRRLSSGDKYLSITVTFTAESRDQLDAIYRELNDHNLVLMTL